MAENSAIQWTTHTFNPWRGCTKVSEGCQFCYADTLSKRNHKTLGIWGPNGTRVIAAESYWRQPISWDAKAKEAGERHRVFCASLADVFEGEDTMPSESIVPVNDARARLFELIEKTPNLDWMLLTKRPENAIYILRTLSTPGLQNIWIGTSVENQARADERIPRLLSVPAKVRFLSCEPLLGPIDLSKWLWGRNKPCEKCPKDADCDCGHQPRTAIDGEPAIHLAIVGCESGSKARDMKPEWARDIAKQCLQAETCFFMKQMFMNGKLTGEISEFPDYLKIREMPKPLE